MRRWIPTGPRPVVLVAALAAMALPDPAAAHPHVWIDATMVVQIDRSGVVALDLDYAFDEVTSAVLIEEFDRDRDSKFSPKERAILEREVFLPMGEFGWFVEWRTGAGRMWGTAPQRFDASVAADRIVHLRFRLTPLGPMPSPHQVPVSIGLYDPTYFTEVLPLAGREALRVAGPGSPGCGIEKSRDKSRPLYFGQFFPTILTITCAPP